MKQTRLAVAAMLVAGTILAGVGPVEASVDVGFRTGVVVGAGMPELSTRPLLLGDLHRIWHPADVLGLGLRLSLGVTSLPYGNNDGEAVIGRRSGYNSSYLKEAVTVVPSLAFAPRFEMGDGVRLTMTFGVAFVMSSEMEGMSLIPLRTLGVAMDIRVAELARRPLWLRLGADWIAGTFRDLDPGLFCPTIGLSWGG